jgi:hypothetical protein
MNSDTTASCGGCLLLTGAATGVLFGLVLPWFGVDVALWVWIADGAVFAVLGLLSPLAGPRRTAEPNGKGAGRYRVSGLRPGRAGALRHRRALADWRRVRRGGRGADLAGSHRPAEAAALSPPVLVEKRGGADSGGPSVTPPGTPTA